MCYVRLVRFTASVAASILLLERFELPTRSSIAVSIAVSVYYTIAECGACLATKKIRPSAEFYIFLLLEWRLAAERSTSRNKAKLFRGLAAAPPFQVTRRFPTLAKPNAVFRLDALSKNSRKLFLQNHWVRRGTLSRLSSLFNNRESTIFGHSNVNIWFLSLHFLALRSTLCVQFITWRNDI